MQINSNIKYMVGSEDVVRAMPDCRPLPIFSELAMNGLSVLSKILLKKAETRKYPDVMTFAFWCRKASISEQKRDYEDGRFRIGRGMAFHIAPSNVPLNFAYSFVAALLAGNASVVRLPSRDFRQTDIVCEAIQSMLELVPELRPYIAFVRYGHEKDINDFFSAACDIRVIWGGDKTISLLRQSPLPPRGTEITLADRYSIAVIEAEAYLEAEDKDRIARGFYNDTYHTDQNACTSPCIVIWLGNNRDRAREVFWKYVHDIAVNEYALQPVQAVDKLLKSCLLASNREVKIAKAEDNIVTRALLSELDGDLANFKGNSGFFMEYMANSLDDIAPICKERCQTVSYYGIPKEDWGSFLAKNAPRGVDRVVPIGSTLDFRLVWDGIDFIRRMSREIDIR
ncbi:acyl-CoA reductase [Selenomonas ruminantium]|nr:acyl-CoA reductase [Selenomonas ruminantium]